MSTETKREVLKRVRDIIANPDKYFGNWLDVFGLLCNLCETAGMGLDLSYHIGLSEDVYTGERHFDSSRVGWTIEVGGCSYSGDNGEKVYPGIGMAVKAGLYLLRDVLEEEVGEEE